VSAMDGVSNRNRVGRPSVARARPSGDTKVFIETDTWKKAQSRAPWAVSIRKCEGGYWAFTSLQAANIWERQV
jgi:hypothetical protein